MGQVRRPSSVSPLLRLRSCLSGAGRPAPAARVDGSAGSRTPCSCAVTPTLLFAWVALSHPFGSSPPCPPAPWLPGPPRTAPAVVRRLAAALLGASLGATLSAGAAVATGDGRARCGEPSRSRLPRPAGPVRRRPVRGVAPHARWCSRRYRDGHVRRPGTGGHGRRVRRHRRRPVPRRRHGPGRRLDALSAGSHAGALHPDALHLLSRAPRSHPRRRGRGGPPRRHAVEHRRALPRIGSHRGHPRERAAMLHSVSPRRTTTSSSTRVPASGARLSRWRASGSGTGVRSGGEGVQAASGAVAPAPWDGPSTVPTDAPSVAPVPCAVPADVAVAVPARAPPGMRGHAADGTPPTGRRSRDRPMRLLLGSPRRARPSRWPPRCRPTGSPPGWRPAGPLPAAAPRRVPASRRPGQPRRRRPPAGRRGARG